MKLSFFKRKRNLYFSIIIMLTIVTGLFSISFSYFVDESSKSGLIKLNEVDNRIQSDVLKNGHLTVLPQQTIEFSVFVISNNNYESKFELYYQTKDKSDLNIYTTSDIKKTIPSHSVYEYKIVVENYKTESVEIDFGIASSNLNKEIILPGEKILKQED